jgi:hypothetical protein
VYKRTARTSGCCDYYYRTFRYLGYLKLIINAKSNTLRIQFEYTASVRVPKRYLYLFVKPQYENNIDYSVKTYSISRFIHIILIQAAFYTRYFNILFVNNQISQFKPVLRRINNAITTFFYKAVFEFL